MSHDQQQRRSLQRRQPPPPDEAWDDGQDEDLLDEEWPPRTHTSAVRYHATAYDGSPGTALVRRTTSTGQRVLGVPARRSALPPRRSGAGQAWPPPARVEREPSPPPPRPRQARLRLHWSLWLGIGMLIMTLGWLALGVLGSWWQTTQDDWHYGYPRTFQADAVVGHNRDAPAHPSHFLALNLNRHILVIELPAGDPSKARIYSGPILLGQRQERTPVTLSFQDVNGDGKPDLLVPPPLPPSSAQAERTRHPAHALLRWVGQPVMTVLVALLTVLALTPTQPPIMRLFVRLLPAAGATATVTMISDQVGLRRAYTLLAVPVGVVVPPKSHHQAQIEARLLATPLLTQQVTVPTTGRGHQSATQGHGLVTFYNQAPTAQTIPSGMLLSGADGVQVVTDQAVAVPAAHLPAQGQVSVTAHALLSNSYILCSALHR